MAEMDCLLFDYTGLILKDWLWVFMSLSWVITIYTYKPLQFRFRILPLIAESF